ncbi:MAG: C10 family peptidase [Acidobacteriota bacterium]
MNSITTYSPRVRVGIVVLLLVGVLTTPHDGKAIPIAERDVITAVESWVHHRTPDARPDAFVTKVEAHLVDGEPVAYIAHLNERGFCLCGADDLVLPVFLYSPNGQYGEDNPAHGFILWEIGERLTALRVALEENDPNLLPFETELDKIGNYWRDLVAGTCPLDPETPDDMRTEPDVMALNLTSTWGQGTSWPGNGTANDPGRPYNDDCPELTPAADEHVLTGCVATAMAQIMYYWKWPNSGGGSSQVINYNFRSRTTWDTQLLINDPLIPAWYFGWPAGWPWANRLQWSPANGGELQMNGFWDQSLFDLATSPNSLIAITPNYLAAITALWNRMPQSANPFSQNFGAATYDWGDMNDEHSNLAPVTGDAEVAKISYHAGLAVNMNYGIFSSGASSLNVAPAYEDHFRYDSDAVYALRDIDDMFEEIQWMRPFSFGGFTAPAPPRGGHEWVVYGYDRSGADDLFMVNFGWDGIGDGWYACSAVNYPFDQDHTTRIAPLDVVRFIGDTNSGDGTPDNPYQDLDEALTETPDNVTLILKAGSVSTFDSYPYVLDRRVTIKGHGVTIR